MISRPEVASYAASGANRSGLAFTERIVGVVHLAGLVPAARLVVVALHRYPTTTLGRERLEDPWRAGVRWRVGNVGAASGDVSNAGREFLRRGQILADPEGGTRQHVRVGAPEDGAKAEDSPASRMR